MDSSRKTRINVGIEGCGTCSVSPLNKCLFRYSLDQIKLIELSLLSLLLVLVWETE